MKIKELFLRLFHIHTWGKWEMFQVIWAIPHYDEILNTVRRKQRRKCLTCGKVKEEFIS